MVMYGFCKREKFEIRISKSETNSNVQKGNDQDRLYCDRMWFLNVLDIRSFGFVSDFGFRYLDFPLRSL